MEDKKISDFTESEFIDFVRKIKKRISLLSQNMMRRFINLVS
ncbi:Uncharacterised protein [Salmonella enterica]|nr:Uncharacterised protein [Salmonella enterica]